MLMAHVNVQQFNSYPSLNSMLLMLTGTKYETIRSRRDMLRPVRIQLEQRGIIRYCYYFRFAGSCVHTLISQTSMHS